MMDFCNKCGFFGQSDERGFHDRPGTGQRCNYEAARPTPTVTIPREVLERVREALARQKQGWENVLELDLMPRVHRANVEELAAAARAAIAALEGAL